MELWREIAEVRSTGDIAALCTIVNTSGSVPRHIGAKMLVYTGGKISGTIGGGNLEKKVIQQALEQINEQKPKLFRHDLLHQHNMCCGGQVDLYIEPIMPLKRLYIFGAGHTGQALAKLACGTDFEIFVIDDRKEYLDAINESTVNKLAAAYKQALPFLPFTSETYVIIATYEHSFDRDILAYCIQKPHAYIGMIGSQRKILLTKKMFLEGGIATHEELEKIDMPVGLAIKAESPYEIAVSILAGLIQRKNEIS
ncbi:MAG: XdhC family protein [Bacteroidetes bacterium]|nr:XdhC family protein [Bacteroidota bacterium]